MMFNVMLSLSVEMDRLVIVSRSVVEFGGGCVSFVVSIGSSLHQFLSLSGKICFR